MEEGFFCFFCCDYVSGKARQGRGAWCARGIHCTSCDASDFLAALTRWHEKVAGIGSRLSLKVDSWSRGWARLAPFSFFFFPAFPPMPFFETSFWAPLHSVLLSQGRYGYGGPPTHPSTHGPPDPPQHYSPYLTIQSTPSASYFILNAIISRKKNTLRHCHCSRD